jgi:hypothetical protein
MSEPVGVQGSTEIKKKKLHNQYPQYPTNDSRAVYVFGFVCPSGCAGLVV